MHLTLQPILEALEYRKDLILLMQLTFDFELIGDRIVGVKILGTEFEWNMGCVRNSSCRGIQGFDLSGWKARGPSAETGEDCRQMRFEQGR